MDSIAQSIVFLESAINVWRDLKELFSQGDLIRISELQQEIHTLKQGLLSAIEFFTELKTLWEELEAYRPILIYTCPIRCTCASMRNARIYHQQDYVIPFLTSLNDNFTVVKSKILLTEPLPNLNKVFSMVIQHERQGNYYVVDDSSVLVLIVVNLDKAETADLDKVLVGETLNKMCSYYGKEGHTVETCYRKHGCLHIIINLLHLQPAVW